MSEHQPCGGCLDGCTSDQMKHCTSCVHESWPCDAHRLAQEVAQLRQERRDSDTARIRMNHDRIAQRDRAEKAEAELAAAVARVEQLRAAVSAFVEHHDNGQAGQPGHPKTYGEQDIWSVEWDRRYEALRKALAAGQTAVTTHVVECEPAEFGSWVVCSCGWKLKVRGSAVEAKREADNHVIATMQPGGAVGE